MDSDGRSAHAWLRLSLIPELTGNALRHLMEQLGSPGAILGAPRATLARWVEPALADAVVRGPSQARLDEALAWSAGARRAILSPDDDYFPALLRETPDPPPVLYAAGRLELLSLPAVAVVGSRNATAQGMRNAEAFARAFADAGCCVVSGLALGIDAAAHRGALAGRGSSIAILGNGIDVVYPRRNAELYAALLDDGLLLSEFAPGTPPMAANFPRRNRLISGIARGCLVVEAALASGSLISARIAADLGRDVFAIPGSIHAPLSKGCHHLIKQGAKLVECAQDVLEEMRIDAEPSASIAGDEILDARLRTILATMGHDPCSVDSLHAATGFPVDEILAALMQLEILGRVSAIAGGTYQRLF